MNTYCTLCTYQQLASTKDFACRSPGIKHLISSPISEFSLWTVSVKCFQCFSFIEEQWCSSSVGRICVFYSRVLDQNANTWTNLGFRSGLVHSNVKSEVSILPQVLDDMAKWCHRQIFLLLAEMDRSAWKDLEDVLPLRLNGICAKYIVDQHPIERKSRPLRWTPYLDSC